MVDKSRSVQVARCSLMIGLTVFACCIVGIVSRLPGTLAVFWPANAVLLGILLRSPRSATLLTWSSAAAGYLAADLVTGSELATSLWLNAANIVGVATGFYAFRWVRDEDRRLASIQSVGYLVSTTLVASASAALVGGIANQFLFDGGWSDGWLEWFASEFVNYMTMVPLVLTFPLLGSLRGTDDAVAMLRQSSVPTALLAVSIALEWVVGGPGAIAFAMPALVTAALVTNVFVTALLTAVSTAWTLTLAGSGHLGFAGGSATPVGSSVQIGLSLLAVAPIAVACVTIERRRAWAALTEAVTHDDLTGALRRDEFLRRAGEAMISRHLAGEPVSVLMMDLDHFKRVNDNLGHRAGDMALASFADLVRRHLDDDYLFARLGGEEFVVLMAGVGLDEATELAETVRISQAQHSRSIWSEFGPTVSIGVASCSTGCAGLAELTDCADEALYQAKKLDRNRTVSLVIGADS
ncbi:diguanylate cyclase (GGDEF)-like protein [Rhodococcus sp. 27YEA15]|uniref:GGDEF domain-containing protein n=1 Tax=Rhodococcus sp. 27YEA15 TaxID=3156259 RepID=UPI003C7BBD49